MHVQREYDPRSCRLALFLHPAENIYYCCTNTDCSCTTTKVADAPIPKQTNKQTNKAAITHYIFLKISTLQGSHINKQFLAN